MKAFILFVYIFTGSSEPLLVVASPSVKTAQGDSSVFKTLDDCEIYAALYMTWWSDTHGDDKGYRCVSVGGLVPSEKAGI